MQWKRTNHECLWKQGRKRDEEAPKPASHVDELGAPSSEEWWVEAGGIEDGGCSWVGEGVVGKGVGVCALAIVLFLRGVRWYLEGNRRGWRAHLGEDVARSEQRVCALV